MACATAAAAVRVRAKREPISTILVLARPERASARLTPSPSAPAFPSPCFPRVDGDGSEKTVKYTMNAVIVSLALQAHGLNPKQDGDDDSDGGGGGDGVVGGGRFKKLRTTRVVAKGDGARDTQTSCPPYA